jgi:hypothetical protein
MMFSVLWSTPERSMIMANETQKDKKLMDEMKETEKGGFAMEKHLTDEELEGVAGGCLCRCGLTSDCGGGGGGYALDA